MTASQFSSPFEAAARAAGALAIEVFDDQIRLNGAASAFGLEAVQTSGDLSALTVLIAPGDRGVVDGLNAFSRVDARVRLIGEDERMRYVRLIGQGCDDGRWRGLLFMAGASPDGGLAALNLETALRQSLIDGAILAYHQPIVALQSRHLAGFEALARWRQPGGHALGPDHFLDVARDHGLLRAVGDAVRGCAARDAAAWRAARPQAPALFVAANATASELCTPDFAEDLVSAVALAGLEPASFKLEISETEVMRDAESAERAMKTLKAAGFSLVLDDFGTGYSSLSRLDRFPFDTVKIDQYFTRAAESDPSARTIIAGVVRIASSYGMSVVAEGMETEAATQICTELGCEYGQGFRFAQALSPEDAAEAVMNGVAGRFEAA